MSERLYFQMPPDPEAFIAAISNLQSFLKGRQGLEVFMDVRKELVFMLAALPTGAYNLGSPGAVSCDLSFSFDYARAYELSLPTEKHITQAFGLMLGAESPAIPDLKIVQQEEELSGAVMIDERFYAPDLIAKDFPELEITSQLTPHLSADFQSRFLNVSRHSIVIAERSFETYVAAALGKAVIEIYPPVFHKRWLTKWTNRTYQMIYQHTADVNVSTILSALRTIWCRSSALVVDPAAAL